MAGPCPACDVSYASLGARDCVSGWFVGFRCRAGFFQVSAEVLGCQPNGESGILSTPRHEGGGRLGAFGSACSRWRAKRGNCGAYRTSRQPHLS